MRLGLTIVALLASGCSAYDDGASGATDDFIDMDTPPSNCSAGSGAEPCPDPGTTGSPEGGPCIDSGDCTSGTACIAPFVDGELGSFVCTAQCIPMMDESAWCLDASACCDEGVVCSSRGLCVPEATIDDSGTADGTAGDSTGMGTSATGDTGATTGTGSSTGAATGTTGMQ